MKPPNTMASTISFSGTIASCTAIGAAMCDWRHAESRP